MSRVTEGERERAIHSLRESYARGDLDDEQFEQRLNALFAVGTSAELRELLPAEHGELAHVLAPTVAASSTDVETVERRLSPGEHVEWVGRPDPARRFSAEDKRLVPVGLGLLAFAIFWLVGAAEASGFFAVVGIPFLAVAMYTAFGRFFFKANRKRRTIYAVTNRRVLEIVRNWRGGGESVTAVYLRSIPNISTNAVADGRGTVEFGITSPAWGETANTGLDIFRTGENVRRAASASTTSKIRRESLISWSACAMRPRLLRSLLR